MNISAFKLLYYKILKKGDLVMSEKFKAFGEKIKNSRMAKVFAAALTGCSAMAVNCVSAQAAVSDDVKTSLSTAFTDVKTDVMNIATTALPAALAIIGFTLAVTIGIKLFKKFAH